MIKTFEKYNESKYVVILISNGKKFVNVNHPHPIRAYKTDFKSFEQIIDTNKIQEYTLEEAKLCVENLIKQYENDEKADPRYKYNYIFKVFPLEEIIEEIQTLNDANKYNL